MDSVVVVAAGKMGEVDMGMRVVGARAIVCWLGCVAARKFPVLARRH